MAVNKKDYKSYGPFKLWTIENFPFIEADFDAITNYQLYSQIVEQMRKLCENQNNLQQSQNEVIDAFNNLENYIDNYFENLDVQEEIDNKLDEMAESGELAEIIAQFLQLTNLFAFDTISDMASSENLQDGLICYTAGQSTYNDGKGAFYKIREITLADVVDGFNIVAITNSVDLVGERLPNYYINEINEDISDINEDITDINKDISLLTNRKIIIIGDSYTNHSYPDITKKWYQYFIESLGLTSMTNVWVIGTDGGGFISGDFEDDFDDITETIDNLDTITDVFVVGGWNDRGSNKSDLYDAMNSFKTLVNTKCPNAKITIGMVGRNNPIITEDSNDRILLMPTIMNYIENCGILGMRYIKNSEFILHNYDSTYWEADGVHPSQLGQTELGYNLSFGFINGFCDINKENITSYLTAQAEGIATALSDTNFISGIHNDTCFLEKQHATTTLYLTVGQNLNLQGLNTYSIAKVTSGYVAGTGRVCSATAGAIFQMTIGGSTVRATGIVSMYVEQGHMFIKPLCFYNNQSLTSTMVDYIYLTDFKFEMPSLLG